MAPQEVLFFSFPGFLDSWFPDRIFSVRPEEFLMDKESRKAGKEGMLEFGELTEKIIGAAIEVHKTLGPGFVESIYEESLVIEFGERSISFQRQLVVPVFYRSRQVGQHRLDLLVEGEIVVELKAVRSFQPLHLAVTRSYLRATGRKHGLLLNFAAAVLQVKRVLAS